MADDDRVERGAEALRKRIQRELTREKVKEIAEDIIVAADGTAGTIISILAEGVPNLPTWNQQDCVGVYPTPLPLPPVGEVPGQGKTDPRLPSSIYKWLVVNDRLPTDPVTAPNLPDVAVMTDLTEIWRYDLDTAILPAGGVTRVRYTATNAGLNDKYAFEDQFILDGIPYWEGVMGGAFGPGYTCALQNQAATNVTYNFFFNGGALPAEVEADAISVMVDYLTLAELESRRYNATDAQFADLLANPDGIIEDTWDNTAPGLEDGYTK